MNNNSESSSAEDRTKDPLYTFGNNNGFQPALRAPQAQSNKRFSSQGTLQSRLNNLYYTTSPTKNSSIASLTRQHMSKASQLSSASMMAMSKEVVIPYTIHDYSSHSGSYHPQHICVNKPNQQASRWSSGLHDHDQYITIKFDTPIIASKHVRKNIYTMVYLY
jgi:hypothetical protein